MINKADLSQTYQARLFWRYTFLPGNTLNFAKFAWNKVTKFLHKIWQQAIFGRVKKYSDKFSFPVPNYFFSNGYGLS